MSSSPQPAPRPQPRLEWHGNFLFWVRPGRPCWFAGSLVREAARVWHAWSGSLHLGAFSDLGDARRYLEEYARRTRLAGKRANQGSAKEKTTVKKELYDPKCEELARHFLDDEPGVTEDLVQQLAAHLQRAAEDFLGSL